MHFEVIGEIADAATIAAGRGVRRRARLPRRHGPGRWRKRKGTAAVRLAGGRVRRAELQLCEAHGLGLVNVKIKRFLD